MYNLAKYNNKVETIHMENSELEDGLKQIIVSAY